MPHKRTGIKTKKSFSKILTPYVFFQKHSTEYEAGKKILIKKIEKALEHEMSILDFGAGDGKLISELYQEMNLSQLSPSISILEPVKKYRGLAKTKLGDLGYKKLKIYCSLNKCPNNSQNLIITNHVLYYVPNLKETLKKLILKLKKNGTLLIILASKNNPLCALWRKGFNELSLKLPYNLLSDLENILKKTLSINYQKIDIESTLKFSNTEKNRNHLFQFLFGKYTRQLPDKKKRYLLSSYIQPKGNVAMTLTDTCVVIKK